MTRVLVTGATSFVGMPIAQALQAQGHQVLALARSPEARARLSALGLEAVPGSLDDIEALTCAARGCELVFHIAGLNSLCPRNPRHLWAVNVEGSINMVRAAASAGVRRVVYTSSAATIGEAKGVLATAATDHRGWFLSAYEESKYHAEQAVVALAQDLDLELICVNPSSVQGPGRVKGSARLLTNYLQGRLRVAVDSHISWVDVRDCCQGHLLAAATGRPGQRYLLCGASMTVRQALVMVAQQTRVRRRMLWLSPYWLLGAAHLVELAHRPLGLTPPVCPEMVRTLTHGHRYDGSLAASELGLKYTPPGQTLADAIAWYQLHGPL